MFVCDNCLHWLWLRVLLTLFCLRVGAFREARAHSRSGRLSSGQMEEADDVFVAVQAVLEYVQTEFTQAAQAMPDGKWWGLSHEARQRIAVKSREEVSLQAAYACTITAPHALAPAVCALR